MNMKFFQGTALMLILGAPLAAQEPRFGLSVNLAVPTGGFSSTTYPPDAYMDAPTKESYDTGLGIQFSLALPVDKAMAVRFSLAGESFSGKATAPGYVGLNLEQRMISLGAEGQFFLANGSAYRQSGAYLLAGVSADFERFESSYGDPYYDDGQSLNKTRLGGLLGVGCTFRRPGGLRYLVEAAYHKTLTNKDTSAGDPPASDFIRFSFGVVL